jgi:hypothetical protein
MMLTLVSSLLVGKISLSAPVICHHRTKSKLVTLFHAHTQATKNNGLTIATESLATVLFDRVVGLYSNAVTACKSSLDVVSPGSSAHIAMGIDFCSPRKSSFCPYSLEVMVAIGVE